MKVSKLLIVLLVAAFALAGMTTGALAADKDFTITANVPSSNAASFSVSKVFPFDPLITTDDIFQPIGDVTALPFGILQLNNNGVFAPVESGNSDPTLDDNPFYYVIDVGANGVGNPDVQFSHVTDAGFIDIGDHTVISFAKVTSGAGPGGGDLVESITGFDTDSLSNITSSVMQETSIDGGFLRVGVGLSTGGTGEGSAVPLTALSATGDYSARLRITTTFD